MMVTSGMVDEAGKFARLVVKTLDAVPVLLALVLLQFFTLGAVLYINLQREANFHTRFGQVIERCVPHNLGQTLK